MASKSIEVNYLAFNTSKNKSRLTILSQNLASLTSFKLSQSKELKDNSINAYYNLTVSDDLFQPTKKFCMGCDDLSYTKLPIIEDIIPIAQVNSIYSNFTRSKTDYLLFLDGDTIFLRSFIADLLLAVQDSGADIAMAHECGSTGISPYPNYNCGFLLIKRNNTTRLLLESWLSLLNNNRDLAKYGNQRLFPHALGIINPRIFSIDSVYNLRCHPVYGNISQVWSPVYMVHNQHLSHYWTNEIKPLDSNLVEILNTVSINKLLDKIDQCFTPRDEPYKPRYVGGTFF